MTIKTYAIYGLSEWHGVLKTGTVTAKVSFTGGTASPSGAVPAYYMTKDPITQFVIEGSKEFKNGFIRLEMQQTVAGEHPRIARPKATVPESGEPVNRVPVSGDENVSEMHGGEGQGSGEEGNEEGESVDRFVKVADRSEAVEWLKENYPEKGYTATKLRTKEAFEAACKECGVEFEF